MGSRSQNTDAQCGLAYRYAPLPQEDGLKCPMMALVRYYLLRHLGGYSSGPGTSGPCGPVRVQQGTGPPAPPSRSLPAVPSLWLGSLRGRHRWPGLPLLPAGSLTGLHLGVRTTPQWDPKPGTSLLYPPPSPKPSGLKWQRGHCSWSVLGYMATVPPNSWGSSGSRKLP